MELFIHHGFRETQSLATQVQVVVNGTSFTHQQQPKVIDCQIHRPEERIAFLKRTAILLFANSSAERFITHF
jgi:hypothetical protein